MKKIIIFLSLLLAIGCHRDDDLSLASGEIELQLGFSVENVTRSLLTDFEEHRITDLNIYLFFTDGKFAYHKYTRSVDVLFKAVPNNYKIFAISNIGYDLGTQTIEQLEKTKLSWNHLENSQYANSIIATYSKAILLTTPQIHHIVLKKYAAKINFNITVLDPTLKLKKFQLKNTQKFIPMFENSDLSSQQSHYYQDGLPYPINGGNNFEHSCYLLENKQGYNPSITHQRDKGIANAPLYATYLQISCEDISMPDSYVTFDIFLGNNNTNDFNINRNIPYDYDIEIKGRNLIDTRLTNYSVKLNAPIVSKAGYLGDYVPFAVTAVEGNGKAVALSFEKPANFNGELKWNNQQITATRANVSAESGVENKLEIMSRKADNIAVVTTATNEYSQRASVTTSVNVTQKPDPILTVNIDSEMGRIAVYKNGASSPTSERTFKNGDELKIVATPLDEHPMNMYNKYEFKGWQGDRTGASSTLYMTMGEDNVAVTATFTRLCKFFVGVKEHSHTSSGQSGNCKAEVYLMNAKGVYELIYNGALDNTTNLGFGKFLVGGSKLKIVPKIAFGWQFYYWPWDKDTLPPPYITDEQKVATKFITIKDVKGHSLKNNYIFNVKVKY